MLCNRLLRKALLGSYRTKAFTWGLKDAAALHVPSHRLSQRRHHMSIATLCDLASGHRHSRYSDVRGVTDSRADRKNSIVHTQSTVRKGTTTASQQRSGHDNFAVSGPTVELLYDAKAGIGEGPFYEPERNQLLWVDISGYSLNFLNLETRENRMFKLSNTVSAVVPVEGSPSKVLALIGRNICCVDRETGATDTLATVGEDHPNNRLNDAKCDRLGRLWCGTMGFDDQMKVLTPQVGSLYSYTGGKVTLHTSGVDISNGIGWNLDNTVMYYVDSLPKKVYAFDYNEQEGAVTNQRVCIDYSKDESLGFPDGLCMDTKGRAWVAGFYGQGVTCWDMNTGKRVCQVKVPAKRITSCCFGGPKFEWLFVTSASPAEEGEFMVEEGEREEFPQAGGIFVVKGLGARGSPAHHYKL